MAAIVTTPVNIAADLVYIPTMYILGSAVLNPAIIPAVQVAGAVHLVLPAPLRRWDGTQWVLTYKPRV